MRTAAVVVYVFDMNLGFIFAFMRALFLQRLFMFPARVSAFFFLRFQMTLVLEMVRARLFAAVF